MSSYLSSTYEERRKMLEVAGSGNFEELFASIPESIRLRREPDIPGPLSEPELAAHMNRVSSRSADTASNICFLGAGAYDHYIPAVVEHVLSRSEFYTSYTPYQAEINQGMLQAIFEYQTMICRLTGMDASNASLYDGATALSEAILITCLTTAHNTVIVPETLHPQYLDVVRTYISPKNIKIKTVSSYEGQIDLDELKALLNHDNDGSDVAAVVIQNPNFYGIVEDIGEVTALAHKYGSLAIIAANPISLGILISPGEAGADICVGEGQPMGNELSFGGPYLGFMAVRNELVRKMPGRIVGETVDREGKRGFILTLQAREQHIRREKAGSNICSNEALNALAATVYLAAAGKQGLRDIAGLCRDRAHYAYRKLIDTGFFEPVFKSPFFNEFVVRSPIPVKTLNDALMKKRIIGGLDIGKYNKELKDCWMLAVTEKRPVAEIDSLVAAASEIIRSCGK